MALLMAIWLSRSWGKLQMIRSYVYHPSIIDISSSVALVMCRKKFVNQILINCNGMPEWKQAPQPSPPRGTAHTQWFAEVTDWIELQACCHDLAHRLTLELLFWLYFFFFKWHAPQTHRQWHLGTWDGLLSFGLPHARWFWVMEISLSNMPALRSRPNPFPPSFMQFQFYRHHRTQKLLPSGVKKKRRYFNVF